MNNNSEQPSFVGRVAVGTLTVVIVLGILYLIFALIQYDANGQYTNGNWNYLNPTITNRIAQGVFNGLPPVLTNAAAYTPPSTNQIILDLSSHINTVYVWMIGTGTNSSASGVATTAWQISPDGSNWFPTVYLATNVISGTTPEITVTGITVSNAMFMKLLYASNSDATYGFPLTVEFVPKP